MSIRVPIGAVPGPADPSGRGRNATPREEAAVGRDGCAAVVHLKESRVPLIVDLDGTLTPSDLLVESFFVLLARNPFAAAMAPFWLLRGKSALKSRIAERASVDVALLPLNPSLISFIREERRSGRKVYLASASDRRSVEAVAAHLGLFDGVFCSDGVTNLSGEEKARVLCEAFGEGQFDYAGNSRVDLAVWRKAHCALLVSASARVREQAVAECRQVHELSVPRPRAALAGGYWKAMRPHQWLKNLLVFLPALASHSFDAATLGSSFLAFIAFCLCASSTYLLNDLIDLPSDRAHPIKRRRPFASGAVPLTQSLFVIPLLLVGAGVVSAFLPLEFAALLGLYYATTLLYSLTLKRRVVVDVVTLSGLYTLRVLAGAAAAGVVVSEWLLAFCIFLFLCLALTKRYSELVARGQQEGVHVAGRGYRTDDTPVVGALAGAAGFAAVLVLALYIHSPAVDALYYRPQALWGVGLLLLYWVSRIVLMAHRGEVQEDPVIFAATDRVSLGTIALAGASVVFASLP